MRWPRAHGEGKEASGLQPSPTGCRAWAFCRGWEGSDDP